MTMRNPQAVGADLDEAREAKKSALMRAWAIAGCPPSAPMMCALRDSLLRRARAGDAEARELLFKAVPDDLPSRIRETERNRRLVELHRILGAALPEITRPALDKLLAEAGERVRRGERLERGRFAELSTGERQQLVTAIKALLEWSRWPGEVQLTRIIQKRPNI